MVKILLGGGSSPEHVQELHQRFPSASFVAVPTREEELREIADADAMIGWPTSDHIKAGRQLRWVHVGSTGIDPVGEVPELIESDIVLTNGRGAHAGAIADHTFAMILTFTRRIREFGEDQKAKQWARQSRAGQLLELSGMTMGILGLGNIGAEVARRAVGFRLKVMAVDVNPAVEVPGVDEVWGLDRIDELIQVSDWLVVTVPRTEDTIGLIDPRRIALMKPSAYLLVVSRGRIVDEPGLIAALREGRLAGAGLDVTATEPLPAART